MANGNKKIVRRIKASTASDSATSENQTAAKSAKVAEQPTKPATKQATKASPSARKKAPIEPTSEPVFFLKPFAAFGRYVANSWYELRQVEWPGRRATWILTLGVIVFCLVLSGVILISDWASQWLIKEVIL